MRQDDASVHARALVMDSHIDLPSVMLRGGFDISHRHDVLRDMSQVDLPRLRQGGVDGGFFVVYLPQGPLTQEGYEQARRRADQLFDHIESLSRDHGDAFAPARRAADAARIHQEGKIAVYIGIENGYPLGEDISLLRTYYERGARYLSVTHFANNQLGDSSTDPNGARWNGLSPLGEEAVREMNRLGMMVDVSHISDETFWDVMAMTNIPVIASHSGAYTVYAHPRNMKDDMIRAMAAKGGVIQINGFSTYLADIKQDEERTALIDDLRKRHGQWWRLPPTEQAAPRAEMAEINMRHPPKRARLSDVVDHIDHVVQLVGIDHVGISMDFDGGGGVDGVVDMGEMGNLTAELLRRGYDSDAIDKIWSGNLLRVMRSVEEAVESGEP